MSKKRVSEPAVSSSFSASEVIEVKAGVFKDTCLQLLDQVHDQAIELVVTKRGEPVARVVPLNTHTPSAFGFMRGTVLSAEDIVSPDFDAWGEPE